MDPKQIETYLRFARRRPVLFLLILLTVGVTGIFVYFGAGASEEFGRRFAARISGDESPAKQTEPSEGKPTVPTISQTSQAVVLEANGLRGAVTIHEGDPYIYSWRTNGQVTCAMVSPFPSGSTLGGTSSDVFPGESHYYPTQGQPVKIKMECSDAQGRKSSDEVTVSLVDRGVSPASSAEDRLAQIGFTLKRGDSSTAKKAIDDIKRMAITTDNERVRAAYHLFFAYRLLGDVSTACRQLRGVTDIASRTDYKRAIDGADANYCFAVD